MGQAATYSVTSFIIACHQKHWLITDKVRLTPGWQEIKDVWAQWITCECRSGGTNSRSGGAPSGIRPSRLATITFCSISQVTAPTKQDRDRMGEQVLALESGEKSLDRASGIFGSRTVRQRKAKPVKEQGPPCLYGIQPLSSFQILQVLVVSPHEKRLFHPL